MKKDHTHHVQLRDMLTQQPFGKIEKAFTDQYPLSLETCDLNGHRIRSLCSSDCRPEFCKRICQSKIGAKRCRQDRLRSLHISTQTGQPYITVCHAGIVFGCVPVMESGLPLGGIFFGQCLWEPFEPNLEAEVQRRLHGLHIYNYEIAKTLMALPVISAGHLHQAAEFLYVLVYQYADLDPQVLPSPKNRPPQASQDSAMNPKQPSSRRLERQLIVAIKTGNRTGVRQTRNALLEKTLSPAADNINLFKARLAERLSALSRAAAMSDLEVNGLLRKNIEYTHQLLNLQTREDIDLWMGRTLDDFIQYVHRSQDFKKISPLKPAIEYMQYNYCESLTLADIAGIANLSVSRTAHLFRQQMGITIVDYLTDLRISHAKRILLKTEKSCTHIAYDVGYNNPSYFTRVFKQITGLTPRQFRRKNKR